MSKKNNQYVPICFLAGVVIAIAIAIIFAKPSLEEYFDAADRQKRTASELQTLDEQMKKEENRKNQDAMKLKSIKQIYESDYSETNDNLAAFGTMFDDIIKTAQSNNLFIRSIEYDTKPSDNTIYANFSDQYNVCKLKFFLVGKYPDLRNFLDDVANNFQYLLSVSDINVTSFSGDTDFILIKLSVSLYSKKPVEG